MSTQEEKAPVATGPTWPPSYLDQAGWGWVPSWLKTYLRPQMLAMLMLGFASGLPLYMFYSKTSIWLREVGIERSTIGFFYWIGLAYTLKWIWAPVIDKTVIPVIGRMFGHRRSWMMVSIGGTVLGLLILSTASPADSLMPVLLGAGLVAFAGATLDVSIDAWRIESAPTEAQANMAASYSLGYRGALLFSGLGLVIAGNYSWTVSFTVMALAMAICAALVILISEPASRKTAKPTDNLPLFAGPWNAVAVGTALIVITRALRWVNVDTKVPEGDTFIYLLAGLAALTFILGGLVLRGTRSGMALRGAMAAVGLSYVFSREIADQLTTVDASSPFFRLAVVAVSLAAIGAFGWLVSLSFNRTGTPAPTAEQPRGKMYETFGTPFLQVWDRFGVVLVPILILVLIYRTSDFTMGVMAGPLYVDLGYSTETIGAIQSAFGVPATFVGLFLGGIVANTIGVMRSLVVGAILTLVTNGFYAYFAAHAAGTDPGFLTLAICADNVAGGFVTTVFIAYLSSLVDPAFAATQYALFSSLYALLNKLLAGFSGVMADAMGYETFFLVTASYAIPAAILVLVVMAMSKKRPPKPILAERTT
ncbi:AmpG family muropeptide MFS transporter [Parvularcula sp. LCG005]|uniref:AmpG family muropeptide MFS transporter n=1 Tax=Parvularcula sp. LCG005 TaxID=3078805 RepID=UPI0029423079|nr:MFS transporter [Parvularcula sp. LCG005]WOI53549.1 MFS transporter [Parvularcula sp. LCG005]